MKRESPPVGSAAEGGVPERLWSLQKCKNRQSLQKRLERPVPCKQGAADLKASPHAADPIKLLMREMPFVRDVCVFLRLLENDDPQVTLERRVLSKRVFAVICTCFAD